MTIAVDLSLALQQWAGESPAKNLQLYRAAKKYYEVAQAEIENLTRQVERYRDAYDDCRRDLNAERDRERPILLLASLEEWKRKFQSAYALVLAFPGIRFKEEYEDWVGDRKDFLDKHSGDGVV